jgi:phosphoribosylformimino-5-aminoimidazole carboxamide ribotide isomerase
MRVIGVIDLKGGRAVHARGGERETYAPVHSPLIAGARAGDPVALAAAYRERLGLSELYVADLDAIAGTTPQRALVRRIAERIAPATLMVDAGVASAADARAARADGTARVVVGLETLPSFDALAAVVEAVGSAAVVFSVDLRAGRSLSRAAPLADASPIELVALAAHAGATAVVLLDLARVGASTGVDVSLVAAVRQRFPAVELLVGGGVRGREDLERLAGAGADGALVATALHEGRLGAADVQAMKGPGAPPGAPGRS